MTSTCRWSNGISAHPWGFCHAIVAAMEALDISMEAFAIAAMRGTRHVCRMVRKHQTTEIVRSSARHAYVTKYRRDRTKL